MMFDPRFLIPALAILAVMLLMAMFANLYRKAGPHEALVVYGFRGTRIIKGRGSVIFPMVENCRLLSLELDVLLDASRRNRTCTPSKALRSPWKRWRRSK